MVKVPLRGVFKKTKQKTNKNKKQNTNFADVAFLHYLLMK